MTQTDLLAVIEDILEVDSGSISLTSSLDDLGWDSLSNISFIAEIDHRTGAQIDAQALTSATTVGDLTVLVPTIA